MSYLLLCVSVCMPVSVSLSLTLFLRSSRLSGRPSSLPSFRRRVSCALRRRDEHFAQLSHCVAISPRSCPIINCKENDYGTRNVNFFSFLSCKNRGRLSYRELNAWQEGRILCARCTYQNRGNFQRKPLKHIFMTDVLV